MISVANPAGIIVVREGPKWLERVFKEQFLIISVELFSDPQACAGVGQPLDRGDKKNDNV